MTKVDKIIQRQRYKVCTIIVSIIEKVGTNR